MADAGGRCQGGGACQSTVESCQLLIVRGQCYAAGTMAMAGRARNARRTATPVVERTHRRATERGEPEPGTPERRARERHTPKRRAPARPGKRPFDLDEMMRRLRKTVRPFTPAAMFQLFDEGHTSVFEILVACIISIRTYEEVTLPTSRKLFAAARTPRQIAALSEKQIDDLIHACTFHE